MTTQATPSKRDLIAPSHYLNPIELCWAKLKKLLKGFGARTVDALDRAVARAMALVTREDAQGWFAQCGYPAQSE